MTINRKLFWRTTKIKINDMFIEWQKISLQSKISDCRRPTADLVQVTVMSSSWWVGTGIHFDICHRMALLRKLYSVTFTCQGQTFQMAILTSKRWKMQALLFPSYRKSCIAIDWRHSHCCRSWPLPIFSRSRILECQYLEDGKS